jgi:hypothetical protein
MVGYSVYDNEGCMIHTPCGRAMISSPRNGFSRRSFACANSLSRLVSNGEANACAATDREKERETTERSQQVQ